MKTTINTLGKFNVRSLAFNFSYHAEKSSAVILGDDQKYWVVTLANMERALKQGYELA